MTRDEDQQPVRLDEVIAYRNDYFRIMATRMQMPSGFEARFFLREEPDVVVCLPVTAEGQIILLKEYRPGPGRYLFEVPGGNMDAGEDPAKAAAREVLEETGYQGELVHLATTYISAYSTARKHIYLMKNAMPVAAPDLEPAELSQVRIVDRAFLQQVAQDGLLTDLDAALASLAYLDRQT